MWLTTCETGEGAPPPIWSLHYEFKCNCGLLRWAVYGVQSLQCPIANSCMVSPSAFKRPAASHWRPCCKKHTSSFLWKKCKLLKLLNCGFAVVKTLLNTRSSHLESERRQSASMGPGKQSDNSFTRSRIDALTSRHWPRTTEKSLDLQFQALADQLLAPPKRIPINARWTCPVA